MHAVTFEITIPSFLIGKSLGAVTESAIFGGLSRVRYRDVEEPPLPADDWVRLEVLEAGICGTDIGTLTFQSSPILEPFGSFPAVLGHEVLARVSEVGPAVRRVEPGQRVAVDPMISCTMRGFSGEAQCVSCASGLHCTCARMGDEGELRVSGRPFQPGMTVGYHNSLPGGWSERMIAHESQLFAVDDALSNRTAALIEPLSIGMHAALNVRPFKDGPALVIGSGPIALGVIWSLRAAGFQGELVAQVKRVHEADIAKSLGASLVVSPGDEARQALVETGARGYKPIVGDEVYAGGGYPLIFDCVGSGQSLTQCLAVRGTARENRHARLRRRNSKARSELPLGPRARSEGLPRLRPRGLAWRTVSHLSNHPRHAGRDGRAGRGDGDARVPAWRVPRRTFGGRESSAVGFNQGVARARG